MNSCRKSIVLLAACAAASSLTLSSHGSAIGQAVATRFEVSSFQDYLDNWLYTHLGHNKGINGAQHDPCRNNIASLMESFGLTVELDPFLYNGQTYYNVVATKTGTHFPNSQYIIGGHYDTVNNPGADDDASGIACMLEMARVLSHYENKHTIKFIAFDREEQGKIGSTAYVAEHNGEDIKAMVQIDMVAHNAGLNRQNMYGNAAALPLKQALDQAVAMYGNGLDAADAGNATFSDHAPFASAGYQAIVFVEANYISNTCYHQPCDAVETPGLIQYSFAANLGRSVAGYLADHAGVWTEGDVNANGVVDVTDLLAVINAWGACPAPPAACPADVAPPPNGNGSVDVSDLLLVINSWGTP